MTSGLRLTQEFDVGVARSSKPQLQSSAKLPIRMFPAPRCAGSSVCVVPHGIGRAVSDATFLDE
jgi:hypothetical protein